ncbi:hypothetical protein [Winogradskyella bathintestinalis]|uniref:Uncharacterized protein n=1 Tax=Winogradskyella bathintestinalis TaxID=3035208 RepID=A0ABT7ZYP3_9FLAO|nr:hypothetical protein [Winogradskyella bathintestinalis]MDN3494112.1 hypothetical protein [Winogradskyella bathintestinalis]
MTSSVFQSSIFPYIIITTFLLITTAIMVTMNFSLNWVFVVAIIGEIGLVLMVFKILKEKYTTDKTFKDFYEDHPIEP